MTPTDRQIAAKREAAAKARRFSAQVTAVEDRDRFLAFATDLDAEADALERGAVMPRSLGPKP
jgi:hypothetical protein